MTDVKHTRHIWWGEDDGEWRLGFVYLCLEKPRAFPELVEAFLDALRIVNLGQGLWCRGHSLLGDGEFLNDVRRFIVASAGLVKGVWALSLAVDVVV